MTDSKITVLLVEDDDMSRQMMQVTLENCGFEVVALENAEEAWSACQTRTFEIGLVDWILPGTDGLELCRQIRTLEWGDEVVLIVVTAHDRPKALSEVLAAGVDDYITKPVNVATLGIRMQIAQQLLINLRRRKEADSSLRQAHDEMEEIVARRTASLERTLMELRNEVEERRLVEEERTRLVTAIEQTDEAIMVTDAEGVIQHVNPAFVENTGFTADQAVGSTPRILKSSKHNEMFYKRLWLSLKAGRVWKGHFINRRADGSLCEVDATISPVRDDSGTVVNFVAVNRDVTETLALERQLRQAHRMEALGRFAGEIAHDFNNLISVAQTTVEMISGRLSPTDPIQEDLEVIRRTTVTGSELTRALLEFGRERAVEPVDLDVCEVIDTLLPVLRRLVPPAIALKIERTEEATTIHADRNQVEQIILNLCANARDAMPSGGSLTIRTSRLPAPNEAGHPSIEVSVSDTGQGMDQDTLAHIFEPFYTTKKPGNGSGLGLSTVYNVVTQIGGEITVSSDPDNGSTFTVSLPAVETRVRAEIPPTRPPGANNGGCENLLIVEDHTALRRAMSKFLKNRGYHVFDVPDGEAALEAIQKGNNSIDLVITDLNLPKMGGLELCKISREEHSDLRFLFCSGFLPGLREAEALGHRATSCLEKPFGLEEVCRQVRELLDRKLEN